jgi:hypothetical protein
MRRRRIDLKEELDGLVFPLGDGTSAKVVISENSSDWMMDFKEAEKT